MEPALLSDEMRMVAQGLEQRIRILRITSRRVETSEWQELGDRARHVPTWYSSLLASASLLGVALEYKDRKNSWLRSLAFHGPKEMSTLLWRESLASPLIGYGFFPFASENDGSLWLAPARGNPSPIHLLELSAWDGGVPGPNNGLIFASTGLEYVLARMAISEQSFDNSGTTSTLMWCR